MKLPSAYRVEILGRSGSVVVDCYITSPEEGCMVTIVWPSRLDSVVVPCFQTLAPGVEIESYSSSRNAVDFILYVDILDAIQQLKEALSDLELEWHGPVWRFCVYGRPEESGFEDIWMIANGSSYDIFVDQLYTVSTRSESYVVALRTSPLTITAQTARVPAGLCFRVGLEPEAEQNLLKTFTVLASLCPPPKNG